MRTLRFARMNIPVHLHYRDVRSSIHCAFRMTLGFENPDIEVAIFRWFTKHIHRRLHLARHTMRSGN